jgi:hypothetical protein
MLDEHCLGLANSERPERNYFLADGVSFQDGKNIPERHPAGKRGLK